MWPAATCDFFHDDATLEKTSMELHSQQSSKCILHFGSLFALYRISLRDTMACLPTYQPFSGTSPRLWSSAQLSLCFYCTNDSSQDHHCSPSFWFGPLPTARSLRVLSQVNRLVNHLFQFLAYIRPLRQLFVDEQNDHNTLSQSPVFALSRHWLGRWDGLYKWVDALSGSRLDARSLYELYSAFWKVWGRLRRPYILKWLINTHNHQYLLLLQVFYYSHKLYVIFFICLFIHAPNSWKWLAFPMILYCVECISRSIKTKKDQHGLTYILKATLLPSRVIRLLICKPIHFTFTPGDFVYVMLPWITRHEWHPITISSAPEDTCKHTFLSYLLWVMLMYNSIRYHNSYSRCGRVD